MLKNILTSLAILTFALTFSQPSFSQKSKNTNSKPAKKIVVQKAVPIMVVGRSDEPPPPKAMPGAIAEEPLLQDLTPAQQRRVDTFNQVWTTIRDTYFDQTFGGVNWNAVRAEFGPKVKSLNTDLQLHVLLQDMINRLNRSHFVIVPPEAYQEIEKAKAESKKKEEEIRAKKEAEKKDNPEDKDEEEDESEELFFKYGLRLDLRIVNSQVVITRVEKDSDVAKAGIRAGFVIEKINGVSTNELISRLERFNAYSKSIKNYMPLVLLSLLEGEEGSIVELTYLDENNTSQIAYLKREGLKGELVSIIKNLPEQILNFESRSLNEKVGYIKFNNFAMPVLGKFCAAITEFKDKEGVIIDLRGNTGGALAVLYGISSLLIQKPLSMGTQIRKGGASGIYIQPMPKTYRGKIVFLVDSQSASAAEMMSAGLQENNRAVVIGEKTSGSALPAITKTLPTGAVFLFAVANYKSPKGNYVEGSGVVPDVTVAMDRKSLLDGKDPQMESAFAFINENKQLPKEDAKRPLTAAAADYDEPPPPKAAPKPTPPPVPVIVASAANASPKAAVENKQDEKAIEVFKSYIAAIGGEDVIKKIESYAARGELEINTSGGMIEGSFEAYRKGPNKLAEILYVDGTDIREAFDGKLHIIQTPYTAVREMKYPLFIKEYELYADIQEAVKFKELYPSLKYVGVFDRNGRKVHLIEATSKDAVKVAFSFDVENKFLISRSSTFTDSSYGEYQKFGDIMFPTLQTRPGGAKIKIRDVKFNVSIDDSKFVKEDNCFTKAN